MEGRPKRLTTALFEERVDEFDLVELDEVVDALAQTDQLHRHAEFGMDGDDDATLGRTIELGEHHA